MVDISTISFCHGNGSCLDLFFFLPLHKFFVPSRMEGTSTEEDLLKSEIEDLPVVRSLSSIHTFGRDKTRYRVNLFCDTASLYGGCKDGSCTMKRVGHVRMSTKHPTNETVCVRFWHESSRITPATASLQCKHDKLPHQQPSRQNVLWMRELPRSTQMTY
jgi:hypothetical protein